MEYIESNFGYLKGTKIEKYYDHLIKAEFLCEYYPIVTKIIVRKVIEMLLRDIAQDSGMDMNLSALTLLNSIKLKSNISFSEEIYNSIEIILLTDMRTFQKEIEIERYLNINRNFKDSSKGSILLFEGKRKFDARYKEFKF